MYKQGNCVGYERANRDVEIDSMSYCMSVMRSREAELRVVGIITIMTQSSFKSVVLSLARDYRR